MPPQGQVLSIVKQYFVLLAVKKLLYDCIIKAQTEQKEWQMQDIHSNLESMKESFHYVFN